MGRILLVALFASIGLWGLLLEDATELGLIQKLARGMGPELAGIVIAAVTIEALAERRQESERKRTLISQLGSKSRDVTEIAVIELRNRGWLYDGLLRGAHLVRADLSGANLLGADLRGASFLMANLSAAAFYKADLSGVNFSEANLSGANLLAANLSGANFSKANLSGAELQWADLSGVNFSETDLSGANLVEGDLSGRNFERANLSRATLWKANLSGADLQSANLSRANLAGANLSRAALHWANLSRANLAGANLSGADLRGAESWSTAQFGYARNLGAIMPDGTRLGSPKLGIAGPSFSEWKEQYLAKHGGTATDIRDTGQTEP